MRGWHLPRTVHLHDMRQGWRHIRVRGFAAEVDLKNIEGIYTSQVKGHWNRLTGSHTAFLQVKGAPASPCSLCMLQTKALWMERLRREKARLGVDGSPLPEVVSKAPKRLAVSYPFSTSPLLQEQVWAPACMHSRACHACGILRSLLEE